MLFAFDDYDDDDDEQTMTNSIDLKSKIRLCSFSAHRSNVIDTIETYFKHSCIRLITPKKECLFSTGATKKHTEFII